VRNNSSCMGGDTQGARSFPIFKTLNAKTRKRFADYTLDVRPRVVKVIESLQPFHRADTSMHLLSQLNRIGNIDKHMSIPVHGDEVMFNLPKMSRALVAALKFGSRPADGQCSSGIKGPDGSTGGIVQSHFLLPRRGCFM
jgi:hypothetical protein